MDRNLLGSGLSLIVLLVALMIGATMVDKSRQIANNITNDNGTTTIAIGNDVQATMTTFTGLLPLAVLGLVGGISLVYFLGFIGRASGGF